MRYLAMLFIDESSDPQRAVDSLELRREQTRFSAEARAAGVFVCSEALKPTDTATVVRSMESGSKVSDGPFIEPDSALSAIYILDCDNLDQAIEWAARIPSARSGAIEVRPVRELDN